MNQNNSVLDTTYDCCPMCGMRFYYGLTSFSNTTHFCPANPGCLTYIPPPWEREVNEIKKLKALITEIERKK